ncbi:MAG: RNA-binding protein [Kiritimatiellae bacterium]|nr:RNA-binding protein [Kiritimatiellia bacterium]
MFGEYGKVDSARVVLNRANGKSKGFGFVVMPNREEAEKAIAAYSEKEVMGRKMRVNEARNTIVE